ncbi:MAG: potassium transporter Kup [Gemmatimonadales bacterium]|nr:potassium transporter Kup [Gemmatimonadales bacterium]MCB9518713.1 potassium transporter Kup [Gemmatimonadales bacterium]HRX20020.1 potassium transporter Kup [Gemmatimonadales bacterium]
MSAPGQKASLGALAFAAIGVVYGDIGTSPLYAIKECFRGPHAVPVTHENILGILSLVFWALNFVVSFKYIGMVMKADNRGEGGILALLALARPGGKPRGRGILLLFGLFGAALLYGDGVITPAISVLGAIEGLDYATPVFEPYVVPLAVVIISALFFVQRRGTAGVGRIFGPVTSVWFVCIALLGIGGIAHNPEVLAAINPWHAVSFFLREGLVGVTVLAAVVLVITGGEALYADMGHFGPRPIRLAWFAVVLPALVLNYFGQGAWLLAHPEEAALAGFNPFYALVPSWGLYPMIVIATGAAVVASQALISGAFSLTQQAMQLGFAPRMRIIHTSHHEKGQIYMPGVNAALWVACLALVVSFRSSENLAATYGVAVSGTMLTTSVLFAYVMRNRWEWSIPKVALITLVFIIADVAFLGANLLKIPDGGFIPILIAGLIFLLMWTWKAGRRQVTAILRESSLPLDLFVPDIARRKPHRVPGVAVFMTSIPDVAPSVLLHHLKHNKVLHEKVVLMTIEPMEIPQVPEDERVTVLDKGEGFFEVIARFGFMESPDVPAVLAAAGPSLQAEGDARAPSMRLTDISFYLGRETLIIRPRGPGQAKAPGAMSAWRAKLFGVMTRNAQSAAAYFGLPPNRVVELGAQIQV